MAWLLAFIGLIFGIACASAGEWALGLFGGALIGALYGAWISMHKRIGELEAEVAGLRATRVNDRLDQPRAAEPATPAAAPTRMPPLPERPAPAQAAAPASVQTPAAKLEAINEPTTALALEPIDDQIEGEAATTVVYDASVERARFEARAPTARPVPPPLPRRPAAPARKPAPAPVVESEPSVLARWLFESSWITKIGITIVLIGLGAFMRLAIKEGWFDFPIQWRLAGIALGALAALVLGWRKREEKRVFALNLQGGAIAVLMMVVFASYRMYQLIPASATFAMLLVLVAGCSVLAIRQNSLGLAVFGVIGGFAAPILTSTGSGNHVALFSFYAVLNLGILAMSWARGWRVLNTLGFLFTFVIGTLWGVTRYRPEDFATTEPFLIVFFLFYLVIPLLPALRGHDPSRRDHVEGPLVFGTPLIAFALQSALLHDDRTLLAISALVMAVIYLGLALYVWKHHQLARWKAAYAGLALIFVTLVFPLAFTSGTTTVLWAIEGALLVWIGLKQDERRLRWAGIALQLFAGLAALDIGTQTPDAIIVLNPTTLGALAIALAALFSAWRYTLAHASHPLIGALAAYGYLAWYVGGVIEVDRVVDGVQETHAVLVFVALSAVLAAVLRTISGLRALSWPGIALMWSLPLFVAMSADAARSPLSEHGAWIWPLSFISAFVVLHCLRDPWPRGLGWAHVVAWLSVPLIFAFEIHARTGLYAQVESVAFAGMSGDWRYVLTFAPFWIALAALLSRFDVVGAPVRAEFTLYRHRALWPLIVGSIIYTLFACTLAGHTPPISYLPILNPLELSQIALLLLLTRVATHELDAGDSDVIRGMIALLAFVVLTAAVLRGVHHVGNEPWSLDMLTRPKAHAALSWTWTLIGAAAMGFGAKKMVRGAWIAGAILLGIVLAKLLLVDMRFLGTVPGIVSTVGVGLLFVTLGYFAPMPPRDQEAAS